MKTITTSNQIKTIRLPRRRADRVTTTAFPKRKIDPIAFAAALEVLG